jgi:hypothetical protein
MATLLTYTTMVQNEVDDVSERAKTVIERAIKDTYQEMIRFTIDYLVGTTEEDVTATADQRYITPTNDYQDIKSVLYKPASVSTYNKLRRITESEYYRYYVNSSSSTPQKYYLNASDIYFDVAPEDAGTVRVVGVQVQDELAGNTASIIPDRFNSVIVQGGIARFKAYEGLPDANEYFNYYRGPYFEQGKIGGQLRNMIEELSARQPKSKIKLFGK